MPDFVAPHFKVPFTFGSTGHALCVEEDSNEEVFQCVEAIVRTTQGQRIDAPEFGIPDLALSGGGPDPDDIGSAIDRWEPRAAYVIDVTSQSQLDQLLYYVGVGVEDRDA